MGEKFCKISNVLPNLVVGTITDRSVLKALERGIQSRHIIHYLESAAHPRALKRKEDGASVVPANVRGQLEVWESNRSRTSSCQAVKISWDSAGSHSHEFELACKYAEADGSFVWSRKDQDGGNSLLFVK